MTRTRLTKKKVFISFDFDHDEQLYNSLVDQAKNPESPFQIVDRSVRVPLESNWKKEVRNRIRQVDRVIVICGEYTHEAKGVAAELTIAQEENKTYFLLRGRPKKPCQKPAMARKRDQIHEWTWSNLRKLIASHDD